MEIKSKYKEIKEDIVNNIDEVFLRSKYYASKYRGDEWNDVNVSIITESSTDDSIQIFLRNSTGYIKDTLTFKNKQLNSEVKTNLEIE